MEISGKVFFKCFSFIIRIPTEKSKPVAHLWGLAHVVMVSVVLSLTFISPCFSQQQITIVGLLAGAGGVGDQSYNDMTLAGIGRAQKQYNFSLLVQETDGTEMSGVRSIRTLLEQGADVVIANGSGLGMIVEKFSRANPDIYFIVNDYRIDGRNNVASTQFAHREGSFLVGILCAEMTGSGKIGFIGGVDMPIIRGFLEGFAAGAQSVSEEIQIYAEFITEEGDYSGFTQPARGEQVAKGLYDQGVDIIFTVAGLTGNGVIQAARERQQYVVGVDADQDHMAKGHVLTSMMKRLDQSTYSELTKIFAGRFIPGVSRYGLENGGVSLSPMKYTRQLIGEELIQQLEQAQQQIISGEIQLQ